MDRSSTKYVILVILLMPFITQCLNDPDVEFNTSARINLATSGVDNNVIEDGDSLGVFSVNFIIGQVSIIEPDGDIIELSGNSIAERSVGQFTSSNITIGNFELEEGDYSAIAFRIMNASSDGNSVTAGNSVNINGVFNREPIQLNFSSTFSDTLNFPEIESVDAVNDVIEITIESNATKLFRDDSGALVNPLTSSGETTVRRNFRNFFERVTVEVRNNQ